MSVQAPGERYSVLATKGVTHKNPAVENRHPGIALKSAQPEPMAVNPTNATAAQQIAIGEEMVIALSGAWPIATSLLPGGAAVGDPLWIEIADNSLANAAEAQTAGLTEAAYVKWGVISAIDTLLGLAMVNLNLRSTF